MLLADDHDMPGTQPVISNGSGDGADPKRSCRNHGRIVDRAVLPAHWGPLPPNPAGSAAPTPVRQPGRGVVRVPPVLSPQ